jgi:glycosyltransferase involved in cell wall biosynthesis
MHVWLLHVGEFLPIDGDFRPMRYSLLGDALMRRGHTVTRWAPTFLHALKRLRFTESTTVVHSPQLTFELLHAPPYDSNTSLKRLRFSQVLAREFRARCGQVRRPDIIVAAIPAPELAQAAVEFGRREGIPVVVDIRDLWPDIYLDALPRWLRLPGRLALWPFHRVNRQALSRASAVVAVSPSYLAWGLRYAGRSEGIGDRVFPLGYIPYDLTEQERKQQLEHLRRLGFDERLWTVCFVGSFEATYDLDTVIHAARSLHSKGTPVQFVLCGTGRKEQHLRELSRGLDCVVFAGWASAPLLAAVMERSKAGLCAYVDKAPQSLPNKPFEYASFGLPLISSLQGDLEELISGAKIGLPYAASDAASLEAAISALYRDPECWRVMSSNARSLFERDYSGHRVYGSFVAHLEAMTGG